MNRMKKREGFTLIEIIIYLALLGGIAVFAVNFLLQTVSVYRRTAAEREVISNARLLLEFLDKTISESSEIYRPASTFFSDTGQLSLFSTATSTPEHPGVYIDFWADNGVLYVKQDGQATTTLSASSVRVSKFNLEEVAQGLGRQAVKITLQVDSTSKYPFSTSLHSATALRGNY